MDNATQILKSPLKNPQMLQITIPIITTASYRGFVSIDQEMTRDIAMHFLHSARKDMRCQKGFVFVKN